MALAAMVWTLLQRLCFPSIELFCQPGEYAKVEVPHGWSPVRADHFLYVDRAVRPTLMLFVS
jgi:hypothetical protein